MQFTGNKVRKFISARMRDLLQPIHNIWWFEGCSKTEDKVIRIYLWTHCGMISCWARSGYNRNLTLSFPCVIGDHLLPLFINKWPCTWCSQWPSCSTKRSSQCPVHWTVVGAGVMQIRTHSWHLREISPLWWPIMTSWYGHTFCITGLLWIHRSAVDYPHKGSVTWRHPSVSMLVFVYQKPPRLICCGSTIWSLFRIASLGCKSNSMVCQNFVQRI